jgi:hypothetical protein
MGHNVCTTEMKILNSHNQLGMKYKFYKSDSPGLTGADIIKGMQGVYTPLHERFSFANLVYTVYSFIKLMNN